MNNKINTLWRNWKLDYAKTEWDWYLSANPSVLEIEKVAKIWSRMYDPQDETKTVHSNYGFQWNRGNVVSQIDYVVNELKENPNSRRAVISIYDGKESEKYWFDTPCTLAIHFQIVNGVLNMTVIMRSCDLYFGFCNDQYCFSNLQKMIADRLGINVGQFFFFASNLHIYERHYNANKRK